jgi:hypothetical protein
VIYTLGGFGCLRVAGIMAVHAFTHTICRVHPDMMTGGAIHIISVDAHLCVPKCVAYMIGSGDIKLDTI